MIYLVPISMNIVLNVVTPPGDITLTYMYLQKIKMEIKKRSLPDNFFIMELVGHDVILGMDWLPKNHADVYYHE